MTADAKQVVVLGSGGGGDEEEQHCDASKTNMTGIYSRVYIQYIFHGEGVVSEKEGSVQMAK